MIYQFIILQFSAHILADFIFQPHRWSSKKSMKPFTIYHVYHSLVVFACSYILSFDPEFWIFALLLTIIHFFTDALKSHLQIRSNLNETNKNYFFTDQAIHLVSLFSIAMLYVYFFELKTIIHIPIQVVVVVTAFILCAKPSNIFIKNIFSAFSIDIPSGINSENQAEELNDMDTSLPNAGKLIGIMERFLVLALIIIGQYSAVGLIIAAKSILRFKSTIKNEYILVGTLLSFGIAVLIGIAINKFFLEQQCI